MKRALSWVVAAFLCLAAIECAFQGYFLASDGELYSSADLLLIPSNAATDEAVNNDTDKVRRHALHPYLGYMRSVEGTPPKQILLGPIPPENEQEEYVIVVTGGSVAGQIGSSPALKASFERELESLGGDVPKIRIYSAANGGYKQPQQLQSFSYLLALGSKIDMIVNIDGFNEIVLPVLDYYSNGQHPAFPHNWDEFVSDVDPEGRLLEGRIAVLRQRQSGLLAIASQAPLSYSATAGWVVGQLLASTEGEIRDLLVNLANHREDGGKETKGPPTAFASKREVREFSANLWVTSSIIMEGLARAQGIAYLHFLQPNQYLEGSKPLSDEERGQFYHPDSPFGAEAIAGYPILVEQGKRLLGAGVAYIDGTLLFRSDERTLYKDSCCHFNDLGISILADFIAKEAAETISRSANASPQ